jgi:hypothetical protein
MSERHVEIAHREDRGDPLQSFHGPSR